MNESLKQKVKTIREIRKRHDEIIQLQTWGKKNEGYGFTELTKEEYNNLSKEINSEWVRLEDAEKLLFIRDAEFESRVKILARMMADELVAKECAELKQHFPKCESCEVFQKSKSSTSRAIFCEGIRACGSCPKDKFIEELLRETKP